MKKRKQPASGFEDNGEWPEEMEAHFQNIASVSDDEDIEASSDEANSVEGDDSGSSENDGPELLDARDGDLDETEREFLERAEKIRQQEEAEQAEQSKVDPRPQPGDEDWDPDLFYDSDDSENERGLTTVGDVPLRWYEDIDHLGYDLEGHPIQKPKQEDLIDEFIALNENPQSWRTVYDEKTGRRIVLSAKDLEYIRNLERGILPAKYDADKWFIPVSTNTIDVMPTNATPEPKTRFIPSRWEAKRIRKLAYAIKKGWIKLDQDKDKEKKQDQFFLIWDSQNDEVNRGPERIPAPKPRLPGHAESYNPPAEFLMTEEEAEKWRQAHPSERKLNFLPQKFTSLRTVPSYKNFQKERFERCLDLYLCSRVKRKKAPLDITKLTPQLPKPADLKPFPATESVRYEGHTGRVRAVSVDPKGQWMISASDDGSVRLWDVRSGRCAKVWRFPDRGVVYSVEFNPSSEVLLAAIVLGDELLIVEPPHANATQRQNAEKLFAIDVDNNTNETIKALVSWKKPSTKDAADGVKLRIQYHRGDKATLKSVTWHHRGDYLATVCPEAAQNAVLIHQLTKRMSQSPFKKTKTKVQCVKFHPTKPFFFAALQREVRVYNLLKQELSKTLEPGVQWISSMDVHPGGDNLIVGSYDKKVCWFDLDLSVKPYKVMRYHEYCIRSVRYHKRYPLFGSCSDDGTAQIFHGTVYSDLLSNPLIVPLKILRGHEIRDELGVLDLVFHTTQPWVFTAGADTTIRLYT